MTILHTAAVIPAYNEEATIGSVVLKAKKHVEDVFVVDDGSIDDTATIAESAGANVIRMKENTGKARAVMAGFSFVRGNDYQAAVMLDADGQHDPDDIPQLIQPILDGSADLVIGSRFMNGVSGIPRYRKAGQGVLNRATSFGSKVPVSDSQSGFRAFSPKGFQEMVFRSEGYNLESDMIVHFAERGLVIKEVPVSVHYDVPNMHKKNSMSHGMGVFNDVVGFIGYRRPLLVFGVPGGFMFVAGAILGFLSVGNLQVFGWGWVMQAMSATLMLIIGLMLVIAGLTLNSLVALMKSMQLEH